MPFGSITRVVNVFNHLLLKLGKTTLVFSYYMFHFLHEKNFFLNTCTHILVSVLSPLSDGFSGLNSITCTWKNCFIYLNQRSDDCISIFNHRHCGETLHEIQWWMIQRHVHYYFLINPFGFALYMSVCTRVGNKSKPTSRWESQQTSFHEFH